MYSFYCFIPCVADPSWSLASGLSTWPLGPISFRAFYLASGPYQPPASPLYGSIDIIALICMFCGTNISCRYSRTNSGFLPTPGLATQWF